MTEDKKHDAGDAAGHVLVTPGTRLAPQSTHVAGEGTYLRDGYIYASLVGQRVETKKPEDSKDTKPVISIHRPGQIASLVPTVGTVVTCKVISMNPRFAKTKILCVGAVPLQQSFSGIIRCVDETCWVDGDGMPKDKGEADMCDDHAGSQEQRKVALIAEEDTAEEDSDRAMDTSTTTS
ncbi:hypothetical protein PTSG_02420 [Salpingoeca rosetta]|uniref:Exosome complex component N-terminal domain-containing protein n=1 Tax=Salpingoeca rosetta (strain ATCC 50818 / BSB-021) TaxID=946362 RepID=F2U257_SALR5|nr:uncharacterized protein PTSG_02420 [Salpingoeca rosetta]EGD81709.1 hypothetical protein PTSG_02420 [Salpingoeca rosetta]|eukprot:XP_004996913.1 hypothetical protein PTSG_02420 [Salpingoeca rosetta]